MRKRVGFALVMLGVCSMILSGILAAVNWIGTDSELYSELQMKAGILEDAGVSEEELMRLDEALAECLRGNERALYDDSNPLRSYRAAISATVFGKAQPAFNDRELTHMEDCRRLFGLLRQVLKILWVAGPVLLILGAWMCRDRKKVRLASGLAPLLLIVPLGAFAAWAAADFNGAFNFFHKLLFTNDLWLLDPRTDLLIRLCPASMFMSMGVRIGILSLMSALFVPAMIFIFTSGKEERAC